MAEELLFGFHPVRELLRHQPQAVAEVVVAAKPGKRRAEIEALSQKHGVALRHARPRELDELAPGVAHNGFVVRRRATSQGAQPHHADTQFLVLVEDVQDPRNLGALIRVCEGAGVGQLMIRDRGSAPISAAAIKTSAGAVEWLDIERFVNSAQVIAEHKDQGFWVYGADAEGAAPWEIDLTGPVLICLGGEESGLRQRTRQLCDGVIGLPMRGRVESLNLATAASAILYEAVRQRTQGATK